MAPTRILHRLAGRTPALAVALGALVASAWNAVAKEPVAKPEKIAAKVVLSVDKLPPGGQCEIAVVLDVQPGWHINANPPSPDYMKATKVTVKSNLGSEFDKAVYPKGAPLRLPDISDPISVYEGRVVIRGQLSIPAAAAGRTEEFDVTINYQACNDKTCEPPAKLRLKGSVPVAQPGEKIKPENDSIFRPAKP